MTGQTVTSLTGWRKHDWRPQYNIYDKLNRFPKILKFLFCAVQQTGLKYEKREPLYQIGTQYEQIPRVEVS